MPFADTSGVELAYVAESSWGATPASPSFQRVRFTSETLSYNIENAVSDEITPNPSVSDLVQVGAAVEGDANYELSYGSDFHNLWEAALRSSFTTGTVTQNVTATGAESLGATTVNVTTDGTGDVSLDQGDLVYFGAEGPYFVTASTSIGSSTSGDIPIAPGLRNALSGAEVVTVRNAVSGGSGASSLTFEKLLDVAGSSTYFRFEGCRINGMGWSLTPGSIATGSLGLMGGTHSKGTEILSGASYANGNANPVLAAPDAANIMVGGTTTPLYFTELSARIANNLRAQQAVGSLGALGIAYGRREVTGTCNAYFEDDEFYSLFVNGAETELSFDLSDGTNTYTFWLPRVKLRTAEITTPGVNQNMLQNVGFQALYDNGATGTDIIIAR
ncbi:MAG: phage tail tube protein [Magnetospiraceae bacterium]